MVGFPVSGKMKRDFFQTVGVNTTVWMHHLNSNETRVQKASWKLHKIAMCFFDRNQEAGPRKAADV